MVFEEWGEKCKCRDKNDKEARGKGENGRVMWIRFWPKNL